MIINLVRFAYLPEGVLGELKLPGGPRLFTIERPYLDNEPFVSAVPEGEYQLEWDTTGRIRDVPRLADVENRSQINIHVANEPQELHGCIGVGLHWTIDDQSPRVINSRKAMELLMENMHPAEDEDGFPLYWRDTDEYTWLKISSRLAWGVTLVESE